MSKANGAGAAVEPRDDVRVDPAELELARQLAARAKADGVLWGSKTRFRALSWDFTDEEPKVRCCS